MNDSEIEIGKKYAWKHDGKTERVIATGPPQLLAKLKWPKGGSGLKTFPSGTMLCEVEVLPNHRLDYARVEDLSPIEK